jgi:hypothetical protein
MQVLDQTILRNKNGEVNPEILGHLENIVLFTLHYLPLKKPIATIFCRQSQV